MSNPNCTVCGQPVSPARWEIGYEYCTSPDCSFELRERRDGYRLILMPKQGFTYVPVDSDDLLHGKSSGRQ